MYIKVISIGLFLSTCHLLVQSIPIKYHNTQPTQNDAVHGPAAGMVLFPKLSDGRIKKIHPIWRKGQGDDFVNQRSKGKAKLFGKQKSDTDETADSSTKMTEMTVSVPDLKTDRFGKLVFDTWGDTLGDPVEDTRFKEYHRGSPSVEFRAPMMTFSTYREEKVPQIITTATYFTDLPTVCARRSTIFNNPAVMQYLRPRVYSRRFNVRTVWMDLRKEIWDVGDSQQCHTAKMTDWNKYINCAIRRNMRMDYLVPKYPLHQQGYYFHLINPFVGDKERTHNSGEFSFPGFKPYSVNNRIRK